MYRLIECAISFKGFEIPDKQSIKQYIIGYAFMLYIVDKTLNQPHWD